MPCRHVQQIQRAAQQQHGSSKKQTKPTKLSATPPGRSGNIIKFDADFAQGAMPAVWTRIPSETYLVFL